MKTLTADELQQLTGYKNGSRQAQWVRDNLSLEPMIGADGRPRLTWHIIEQAALARRVGDASARFGAPASAIPSPPFTPKWRRTS